jgi:hypothetical protein
MEASATAIEGFLGEDLGAGRPELADAGAPGLASLGCTLPI